MPQRARSILLFVAAASILPIAAWATLAPHAARAHAIGISDFIPRSDRLFVSPGLTGRQLADIEDRLSEAANRVQSLFGAVRASPTVIIAADEESALRYSTNLYASTHVSPLGTAYVMLGPEGLESVDVIAHELAHAEHFERVGYLRWLATPFWFIEGLGMQVDHRSEYSDDALSEARAARRTIPTVSDLFWAHDFSERDLTMNYAASREAVAGVLAELPPHRLPPFLEGQSVLRPFHSQLAKALAR